MVYLTKVYLLLILSVVVYGREDKFTRDFDEPHKIAIIGGGISGAATAYFLNELSGKKALIDVYESGRVGGRLATASIGGERYEVGGAVLHPDNRYMRMFVRHLGLEEHKDCPAGDTFGLFDGSKMVFRDSKWSTVTIAKLFWRYGLSMYRLTTQTHQMLARFSQIYALQRRGLSFKSVHDLLYAMYPKFPEMMAKSTRDYLSGLGISDLLIDELVTAVSLCNYAQSPAIQAFVGSVSIAGAAPGLWSVAGGNEQVPEQLLSKVGAVVVQRRVSVVNGTESGFRTPPAIPA